MWHMYGYMWVATCSHTKCLAGVLLFYSCLYLALKKGEIVGLMRLSSPHRLLVVLEGLAGLLIGADLLAALPLDVTLLHLLQQEVGPAQPSQHRVGRVRRQEH